MLGGLEVLFQSMLGSELSVAGSAKRQVGSEKDSPRNKEDSGVLLKNGEVQSRALCLVIMMNKCA